MIQGLKERIDNFMLDRKIDKAVLKYTIRTSIRELAPTTIKFMAAYTLIVHFAVPKNIVKKCLFGGFSIFLIGDILTILAAIAFVLTKGEIVDKIERNK